MAVLRQIKAGLYTFMCPGCGHDHMYWTKDYIPPKGTPEGGPRWDFKGEISKPTFTPSLLNRCGHYAGHSKEKTAETCGECIEAKREGRKSWCEVCHLFVTEGKIVYCGDCTHELAGQTVDMIDYTGFI